MPRVNIDAKVWNDPRVKRLARKLEWRMSWTVGALAAVWNVAYEAREPVMSDIDIDTAAEHEGFADYLTCDAVQLGERQEDGRIFLRGVVKRIQFLLRQAELGSIGGRKRAHNAQAIAKPSPSGCQANSKGRSSPPLAPDLPPALPLTPDPVLDQEEKKNAEPLAPSPSLPKAKKKPTPKYTEDELAGIKLVLQKLTNRNQVKYEGSEAHKALIASRLRAGYSTWDLRRVIAYCADHLGWQDNPDMIAYLRPETLFGPKTMEKYVYAARSWDPAGEPPEAAQQGPPKTENVRPGANGEASEPASNVIPLRPQPGILGMFNDPAFEEPSWMTQTQTTTQK